MTTKGIGTVGLEGKHFCVLGVRDDNISFDWEACGVSSKTLKQGLDIVVNTTVWTRGHTCVDSLEVGGQSRWGLREVFIGMTMLRQRGRPWRAVGPQGQGVVNHVAQHDKGGELE